MELTGLIYHFAVLFISAIFMVMMIVVTNETTPKDVISKVFTGVIITLVGFCILYAGASIFIYFGII